MAIEFDGSSGYIPVQDNTNLRPVNITLACWFRLRNVNAGSTLISKAQSGPPWGSPFLSWMIRVNSSSALEMDVGNTTTYSAFSVTISPVMVANQWYHACLTYNGTTLTAYFDGAVKGTNGTVTGNINYSGNAVLLGANHGASPAFQYISGSLADVRIYNRALTTPEVVSLYASRGKYHPNINGLIGYWPLDDKSIGGSMTAERILDRSQYNHFGTGSGGGVYIGQRVLSYGGTYGVT